MIKNKQLYLMMLLSLLFLLPQYAQANWLGDTWHKTQQAAHHASNAVSNTARHAGNAVSNTANQGWRGVAGEAQRGWHGAAGGAQRGWHGGLNGLKAGAGWAAHQAELARQRMLEAARRVQQVTNEGWDYLKKFAQNPTGNCEQVQRYVRGESVKALPSAINNTIGRLPAKASTVFLATATCKSDVNIGFRCGVFPYANNIAKAIVQGGRYGKHLAHNVGVAARGVCSRANPLVKGDCAIIAAVAMDSKKSFQCIKDIASQYGGFKVAGGGFNKQEVCTKTGEFAFGMALDSAIANGAGVAKNAVKFAQMLRSGLAFSKDLPLPASCRF